MAWRLLLASYFAFDASAQDSERFPLSGGIQYGLSVKLTATKIDRAAGDEFVKFEFETPGGDVAFAGILKKTELARSSKWAGTTSTAQTWGGAAVAESDEAKPITIDVLKTKFSWMVSVNNARTPWFDFEADNTKTDLITHIRVYKGLVDPQIVLTRPACTVSCHASECSGGCKDANGVAVTDFSKCFTTIPGASASTATCKTSQHSNNEGHCCDGKADVVLPGAALVKKWVKIVGGDDATRACTAYSITSCPAADAGPHKVDSFDITTRVVGVKKAGQGSVVNVPVDNLQYYVPQIQTLNFASNNEMKAAKASWDWTTKRITTASGNFKQGWYGVAALEKAFTPWIQLTQKRFDALADSNDNAATGVYPVGIIISDVDADGLTYTSCTDFTVVADGTVWKDDPGNTCADYKTKAWCTLNGEATQKFKDEHGGEDWNDGTKYQGDNKVAGLACCACGGGQLGGSVSATPPLKSSNPQSSDVTTVATGTTVQQ